MYLLDNLLLHNSEMTFLGLTSNVQGAQFSFQSVLSHTPLCSSVVLSGHPQELTGNSVHSVRLQAQQSR